MKPIFTFDPLGLPKWVLRVFDITFNCPDCGTPVKDSTLIEHLDETHPGWKLEARKARREGTG